MSASPRIDDLFAAAREDAPSGSQHDAMWDRVATATGVAAAGAAVSSGAAKTVLSGKLLALGGLLGIAGTAIGVVATTSLGDDLRGGAPLANAAPVANVAPAHLVVRHEGAKLAETRVRAIDPAVRDRDREAPKGAPVANAAPEPADPGELLAREVRLVTEARSALVAGDAARALVTVRKTRGLAVRALEPEEISLEARALHALGRVDEAAAKELELRRRYPSHALAR